MLKLIVLAACAAFATTTAHAQGFPNKPVRIVVAQSPGSTEDAVARLLCNELGATAWKDGCVVENRPGAAGFIGAQAVAKSAPDGYTLFMGSAGIMAVNPHLYKTIPYDAVKDFEPISLVGSYPYVLVAGPKLGASSFAEFNQLAKKASRLTYATYGPGSLTNIAPQLLKSMAGIPLEAVAYKGSGDALPNVSSGEVDVMFEAPAAVEGFVKGGRLRALAVTSTSRLDSLPQVPTFAEVGHKGLDVTQWSALFAPAGTPPAVLSKLAQDVGRALQVPDLRERMSKTGIQPTTVPAAQTKAFHRAQYDRFGKVIKDLNIRIE
ncbi:MAG TPA: tripartite tricarboxylate transporter substrate binding protein [Ramlibacter sp.]|nr:tripartite tricarboxylate transporter substrate binding protein [Ramlibacter sp.]